MSLSSEFYISNRQRLMDRLPEGTTVLLFAGKSQMMCQDSEYRFLPDRNFFYMTGLSYEAGKLVMTNKNGEVKTELYAPQRDSLIERWHGKRMPFERVSKISGIDVKDIYPIEDFDEALEEIINSTGIIAFDEQSIMAEWIEVKNRIEANTSAERFINIALDLISLRMVKQDEEINAIREAARMTEVALAEMKKLIRPGVTELELYTALDYHMARQGALIPAFPTIVANGTNSFYLHHSEPEDENGVLTTNGGTIQIDVGARKDGYCGDISRVYFVGDKTSEDDRRFKLLELIRLLRQEAFAAIKPGMSFPELNDIMREITGNWLVNQGLLQDDFELSDVNKYYWHNTGHHLGLDVHDCNLGKEIPFEKGNCLAIEPGVYIEEWGIGFRIEDDVLVTEDGCELLSSGIDSTEDIVIS